MATKPKPKASPATAIALPKATLPANYEDQMAADVAALSKQLAVSAGKSVQVTQAKKFRYTMDDEQIEVDTFKGVIVAFVAHNAYYEGAYNKDNVVPPNCFAIGTVKNDELVSSENAPDPQNGESGDCKSCWANQWKSAATGNGKACKNAIKLAVLMADGEVRPLSLSSTALKAFGEYCTTVARTFTVAPYGVMTTFSFDPKSEYASVRCSNPIKLEKDQLAVAMSMRQDAMAMLQTEPDVSEFQEKVVDAREKPKGKGAVKPPVSKGKSTRVSA